MPNYSVPDRWTDYDPFHKVIKDTRFLPIKVPLKEEICKNIDEKYRLTPDDLLELCRRKSYRIGLVIDLTFTSRYYDCEFFETHGIKYEKIATGGGVIPNSSIMNKFRIVVNDFLSSDSDEESLIAVHCTHGVNRTGYIVCHYMITQMKIDVEEAIRNFKIARGYPIERPNYLEELRHLKSNGDSSSHVEDPDEDWSGGNTRQRTYNNSYVPNPARRDYSSWQNQNNYNRGWRNPPDFQRRPNFYDRPAPYSQQGRYQQSSRNFQQGYQDWRPRGHFRPYNRRGENWENRSTKSWRNRRDYDDT